MYHMYVCVCVYIYIYIYTYICWRSPTQGLLAEAPTAPKPVIWNIKYQHSISNIKYH